MNRLFDKLAEKIVDRLIKRVGMNGIRIATVNVQPGDLVIVNLTSEVKLTETAIKNIERQWESLFANNRVVVTQGMNVSVIHALPKPVSRH